MIHVRRTRTLKTEESTAVIHVPKRTLKTEEGIAEIHVNGYGKQRRVQPGFT